MKNETGHVAAPASLGKRIVSIKALLSMPTLAIPDYQRPYKWTAKHVNQLFGDIAVHQDKPSYRLGTIVLHRDGETLNIVDGQQRTITLMLAARALLRLRRPQLVRKDLCDQLDMLARCMIQPAFAS